jgi:dipeptidase
LQATGDPENDRYPFSVKPDAKVTVPSLTAVMRDCYEGTQFDVTRHPAFRPGGKPSPLARPFGSRELFDLVGVQPERCISTETSGYVYVSQIRDGLPAPVSGCMWLTLGPAATSCFVPVYCGARGIAGSWSRPPDFTRIDLAQVQWKFQLVDDLTSLKYQEAIGDVRKVLATAEARFVALQPEVEEAAVRAWRDHGANGAEQFVTAYSNSCMEKVDEAYGELVDYLMFKYLYSYPGVAPPRLPQVGTVAVPAMRGGPTRE